MAGCSMSQDLLGAPHSGIQKDGSYLMSEQEQGMGCRALQDRAAGLQQHMQTLSVQAVEQMQQVPGTVVSGWQRLVGNPGDGVPAIAEYKDAQAETVALNRTISSKGCNSGGPSTTTSFGTPPLPAAQVPAVATNVPMAAAPGQIPPFQTSAPVVTPDPLPGWGNPISTASIPH
jgi:hypothetical protein